MPKKGLQKILNGNLRILFDFLPDAEGGIVCKVCSATHSTHGYLSHGTYKIPKSMKELDQMKPRLRTHYESHLIYHLPRLNGKLQFYFSSALFDNFISEKKLSDKSMIRLLNIANAFNLYLYGGNETSKHAYYVFDGGYFHYETGKSYSRSIYNLHWISFDPEEDKIRFEEFAFRQMNYLCVFCGAEYITYPTYEIIASHLDVCLRNPQRWQRIN